MSDFCVQVGGDINMDKIKGRDDDWLAQMHTAHTQENRGPSHRLAAEHVFLALPLLPLRGEVTLMPLRNSGTGPGVGNSEPLQNCEQRCARISRLAFSCLT